LVVAVVITGALSRLKPAAPGVDKATVWPDTVKQGPMLRDCRGLGTLVPVTIHVISAPVDGVVTQRYMLPGTPLKANTLILDMANPLLQQQQLDAEYQLKGAQATYEQTKALLQNQLMDKRTQAAAISSQYHTADLQSQANKQLNEAGIVADLVYKQSVVQAEELAKENDLAQKEVETFQNSIESQLAVQEAAIAQKRALYGLYSSQMEQLHIRPGIDGMFQELDVDVDGAEGGAEDRGNTGKGCLDRAEGAG
jgi:multidrug efflux pump subunit AcrA (membrane-fusion protein)